MAQINAEMNIYFYQLSSFSYTGGIMRDLRLQGCNLLS